MENTKNDSAFNIAYLKTVIRKEISALGAAALFAEATKGTELEAECAADFQRELDKCMKAAERHKYIFN